MDYLISIIIPVYKVEAYIEKCMRSLLEQTYTNFEVLVVDDGSPDSSIKLAKSVVADDPRFLFFEKENGGIGTARNLGLDNAKGDFITFLDSDDSYTPDMLYIVNEELSDDTSIDVLAFGMNAVDEEGNVIRKRFKEKSLISTENDILLLKETLNKNFCDKVFRKKVISTFRFSTAVKTYEDVNLIYKVLYGRKIKNISNCLYNYTQRLGSTVNSVPESFMQDKKMIVDNAKKFLDDNNLFSKNENYYTAYYLVEMFYKPLMKIAIFSDNYNADVNDLLSVSDYKMLSFKNIYSIKPYSGVKGVLVLSAFKLNKTFFRLITQVWFFVKGSRKGLVE